MTARDIDYYALGLGPGSFTALRIGHSVVKALAWANHKPVAGIPTLDIISGHPAMPCGDILTVVDAKRSLLYSGFYRKTSAGVRKLSPERLFSVGELVSYAKKKFSTGKGKEIIIVGDGIIQYGDAIKSVLPEAVFLDKDLWYPQPQPLISSALRSITAGKLTDPFVVEPIYLYPQDCQVRGKKSSQ